MSDDQGMRRAQDKLAVIVEKAWARAMPSPELIQDGVIQGVKEAMLIYLNDQNALHGRASEALRRASQPSAMGSAPLRTQAPAPLPVKKTVAGHGIVPPNFRGGDCYGKTYTDAVIYGTSVIGNGDADDDQFAIFQISLPNDPFGPRVLKICVNSRHDQLKWSACLRQLCRLTGMDGFTNLVDLEGRELLKINFHDHQFVVDSIHQLRSVLGMGPENQPEPTPVVYKK